MVAAYVHLSTRKRMPILDFQRAARRLAQRALHGLYPPVCTLCGAQGMADDDICVGCREDLPFNTHACPRCALPLPDAAPEHVLCGRCQQRLPAFERALTLVRYAPPADRLLLDLKFQGKIARARLLGNLMAERLTPLIAGAMPACLIPVPLHPSRLRERGFNQALELARPLAERLNIPLNITCCRRVRATAAQSGLAGSQRRANVRGAFSADGLTFFRHVALIDDVITTGHTANELSRVLHKAGAEIVEVWAYARAGVMD